MGKDGRSPLPDGDTRPAGGGRTAAVLSGGAGTRMGGREKGLLSLGKTTFIEKKTRDLAGVFTSVIIVTARPGMYAFLESGAAGGPGDTAINTTGGPGGGKSRGGGAAALGRDKATRIRVVGDLVEGLGALGGIYTALKAAEGDAAAAGDAAPGGRIFITTSDTPFLVPELAAVLFDRAVRGDLDVFIPRWNGMIEPLCGVYSLRCIPAIERIMPQRKIRLFYPRVRTGYLSEAEVREIDPEGKSFININTEEDYRRHIGPGP